MRPRTLLGPAVLWLAGGLAFADDAALRRCRGLPDPAARLACYDALPLTAAPASAAPPVAAAALPEAAFGLDRQEEKVREIASRILGRFQGWRPGERIRLANGQVWQVSDDSSGVYDLVDPKVTVRRASMGTFMLDVEGARLMPRVRRLE